jgi:hypothetical protein
MKLVFRALWLQHIRLVHGAIPPILIRQGSVLNVLRHVEDKWPLLCLELPESFAKPIAPACLPAGAFY